MKQLILFLAVPFFLAGCLQIKTQADESGGVYRSRDNGQSFERITKIKTTGPAKNFSQDNTEFLQLDITDPNTLYYSSVESGLFVSNNGGNSWSNILKNKGLIKNMAIDPDEPCHIYAQTKQNIFQSIDCGRRWKTLYLEKVSKRLINDIVLDTESPNRLFMTLSDGSILLSEDYAVSWRVWYRFEDSVNALYINPKNTQIMYAQTKNSLFRSENQGLDWEDLGPVISKDFKFKGGNVVKDLVFISEYDDGFYIVSNYGVLKSIDSGKTWEELTLLPRPKKEKILSLAVNPANMNELYYGTASALYYSQDGGVNWQTLKSPTTRQNKELLVHPVDSSILYVGVYSPPKK